MTNKVNSVYESILSSIETPSLVPVGPITVSSEPIDGEVEVIDDAISETEIATKIITKAKKLRKKIGDESYHYVRAIIDLAEKLLEMHPDIQIGEVDQVEESHNPNHWDDSVKRILTPDELHIFRKIRAANDVISDAGLTLHERALLDKYMREQDSFEKSRYSSMPAGN